MSTLAPSSSRAVKRRIHPHEYAFLRAVLQGMTIRDAADRYLDPGMDLRLAQSELRRLRTELLVAARRAHAYGDGRILQLDMAQLPTSEVAVAERSAPTLEDFRSQVDPGGDFYSEAELVELFREQYPPAPADRRAGRIARLRDRQRRALDTLEQVLVQPPKPQDPPSAWLDERVAKRLHAVGLNTLERLAEWINIKGHAWHTVIPRVGAVAAARVVAWFDRHERETGLKINRVAQATRGQLVEVWKANVRPETRVVPIERLAVPSALDGSQGSNRVAGSIHLEAPNDYAAIQAWLAAAAGGNDHTLRTYRREAERLLLWSIFERRKPMSSLSVEDAIAFRAFLANPVPADRWIGPRNALRLSPDWRPFTGPLAARSVAHAITVVGSMAEWLVRQRYLALNVFAALPREDPRSAAADADLDRLRVDSGRHFTQAQWAIVRETLSKMGDDPRSHRTRLLFALAYTTGLRISELVDARIGRLEAVLAHDDNGDPHRYVQLAVLGKGGKVRAVPVIDFALELLNASLASRGLPDWVQCQQQGLHSVRLLAGLRSDSPPDESLDPSTIYLEVKHLFDEIARSLRDQGMALDAETFERGSTHWLRHTFGRHAMAKGVKPNVLQAILGHASLATTTLYSSAGAEEAHRDVERFTGGRLW